MSNTIRNRERDKLFRRLNAGTHRPKRRRARMLEQALMDLPYISMAEGMRMRQPEPVAEPQGASTSGAA